MGGQGRAAGREDSQSESCRPLWDHEGLCLTLTAEGVVPPADGDSGALTGLGVRLHIVAERRLHAVVLTHVVDAVTQESLGGHQRVAGLEAVRQDDMAALSLVKLLLICGAVGVDVWTSVGLTAAGTYGYISNHRGNFGVIFWFSRK